MGLERLPKGVSAKAHDPVELAGFPGAIEVYELIGTPRPADFNDTGELWTRTPFI